MRRAVFAQIETWNPARLRLLDWAATGGQVIVALGRVEWTGEIVAPMTITLTKWFHVEPCTWTETVLWEELWLDQVELEQRPVRHPQAAAGAVDRRRLAEPSPCAGQPAQFTLLFGNTGGYENDVRIRNDFPPEAPFASSVPPPTHVDPSGLWVEWDSAACRRARRAASTSRSMIHATAAAVDYDRDLGLDL